MSDSSFTVDRFLGGRVIATQPRTGFRAGHDTVFLAASVPAKDGENILEFGAGVGIASLCLTARVDGVKILGIEIDSDLVRLANDNAERNGQKSHIRFLCGRIEKTALAESYDHVFFNPPFHPNTGRMSPNDPRNRAMRDDDEALSLWARLALASVKEKGTVTAVVRADRQNDILKERQGNRAVLFPLFPHAGEPPKRTIIQIIKGDAGGINLLSGLVLHPREGGNTPEAEAVLRQGKNLPLV